MIKRRFNVLILTRKPSERILIGDTIVVTVLGVVGNNIKIGIDAPKDVSVHREEVYNRIKKENLDDVMLRMSA